MLLPTPVGHTAEGLFHEDVVLACLVAFTVRLFGNVRAYVSPARTSMSSSRGGSRVNLQAIARAQDSPAMKQLLSVVQNSQMLEAFALEMIKPRARSAPHSVPHAACAFFQQSGCRATFGSIKRHVLTTLKRFGGGGIEPTAAAELYTLAQRATSNHTTPGARAAALPRLVAATFSPASCAVAVGVLLERVNHCEGHNWQHGARVRRLV